MAEPSNLHQRVLDQIHRRGPLPFSAVVEAALYDPATGFFTSGAGAPGRRGDFITSPEVGPLFGAVLARALDTWWDQAGRPDPFVVIDAGAGTGALAVAILAAEPRCAPALHYVLVERSPALRSRHGEHLALAPPATSLGVEGAGDGPVVVSLGEMPAGKFSGVVIANELLDNLAFDLIERIADGWNEVLVGAEPGTNTLDWTSVPASDAAAQAGDRFAPDAPVGAIIPWQRRAGEWARDALGLLDAGRLVVIDYGVAETISLAHRPVAEWLRTYKGHERAGGPLESLGESDITVDVCIDQLAHGVGRAPTVTTQAAFLRAHGIDELVAEGRRIWTERAHLGDLAAIRGRSRVNESEALLDPDGLGAFLVAEWVV